MAPHGTIFNVEDESKAESEPYHNPHLLERISHEVFKNACLDRRLKRHHITGTLSPDNNALLAYMPQALRSPGL